MNDKQFLELKVTLGTISSMLMILMYHGGMPLKEVEKFVENTKKELEKKFTF